MTDDLVKWLHRLTIVMWIPILLAMAIPLGAIAGVCKVIGIVRDGVRRHW